MPSYESPFFKAGPISKLKLCEILGLDTSLKPLNFTPKEIKHAYKKRALRVHPDKRVRYTRVIPEALCSVLMADIGQAQEHLLAFDDNIPGSGTATADLRTSVSKRSQFNAQELADNIKWIVWLARLSFSTIPLSILFSQFTTDYELYIRYVNLLPQYRSRLQSFNPEALKTLLKIAQQAAESSLDSDSIGVLIHAIKTLECTQTQCSPFFNALLGQSRDPILFHAVLQDYKPLLKDDVIDSIQTIATLIKQFLIDIPTCSHIIGTYLSSMIFTTDRLIKIISVYRDLACVVREQKNTFDAMKIYASIFVLSLVILPLNITASIIHAEIRSKLLFLASGCVVAYSVFQLSWDLYAVVCDVRNNGVTQNNFGKLLKNLITFTWNVSARYPLEIALGLIDNLLYWLGEARLLQPKMNETVDYLERLHRCWFTESIHAVPVSDLEDLVLTTRENDRKTEVSDQHCPNHLPRFDDQPVRARSFLCPDERDMWLNDILRNLDQENVTPDDTDPARSLTSP